MEGLSSFVRRAIVIEGLVQGVGFRPAVFNLARRVGVVGFVRNESGVLFVEVEGEQAVVSKFVSDLSTTAPRHARIQKITCFDRPLLNEHAFNIARSESGAEIGVGILPDLAPCAECLEEMEDVRNHRFGFPFTNCTQCGPRFTIICATPYDRVRTTMARFHLCAQCEAEYSDLSDRRFHAQAIACPACGPRLCFLNSEGQEPLKADPIQMAHECIRAGKTGALKGIGGFQLFCDATNREAVSTLRVRKGRDERPFAVMVRDVEHARELACVSPLEEAHLVSTARPIVLLRPRADNPAAAGVSLKSGLIGAMLPSSPLHHLLLETIRRPLVMTSGNRAHSPLVIDNAEAIRELGPICDFLLTHDRKIYSRCDDSVLRVCGADRIFIRRSRGYVPAPIELTGSCGRHLLAVGGHQKCTFALGKGEQAIISQHLGDLDEVENYNQFQRTIAEYESLFQVRPAVLVHDLHPDYLSTRYAVERASDDGLKLVGVQHHHAHMAACMAEHRIDEKVIGVIFDGTGCGLDGTVWGGEFLVGDFLQFKRVGYFREVRMPGGEQAVREPWRMAAAYLIDVGIPPELLLKSVEPGSLRTIGRMVRNGLNSPLTSSCGRFLDAVASMVGIRDHASYDGQAAIELEAVAAQERTAECYAFEVQPGESMQVDLRTVIRAVFDDLRNGKEPRKISRRIHMTLANVVGTICRRVREDHGLGKVVLSGGVFANAILLDAARTKLEADGFQVYCHDAVPPNDGGLCLGQLAIAAAQIKCA